MAKSLILIVGRPNVGKSTLFNRIISFNKAIISSEPGTTRDQNFASFVFNKKEYEIGDTSGISLDAKDSLNSKMDEMVFSSLKRAKAVIFVVDRKTGLLALDIEIFNTLRKFGKPVFVAVNKFDDDKSLPDLAEFYALGHPDLFAVSAAHNKGIEDLLVNLVSGLNNGSQSNTQQAVTNFSSAEFYPYPTDKVPNVPSIAVLGRPNVGKSTLINCWLGKDRILVSDQAGTTRDSVDILIKHANQSVLLIDTAGLRRKSKVVNKNEFMSNKSTLRSIELSDVCLLLIDAKEGYTDQDAKILNLALDKRKAVLLAVNKWDLVDKNVLSANKYRTAFYITYPYLNFVDIFFISALAAKRTTQLLNKVFELVKQRDKKVNLNDLNKMLAYINRSYNMNSKDSGKLKIKYGLQVEKSPPLFIFYLSNVKLLNSDFEKYVENQLRRFFGFKGVPIKIIWRSNTSKDKKPFAIKHN